ncbi:MAG: hypothetical protein RIB32_03680 [Phycisphaerales bacterium]
MDRIARRASACLVVANLLAPAPHALAQPQPTTIDQWARETIELPPGFAPDMPSGVEELRFPPGWRDPNSENYWSYSIVMRIDESAPSTTRLEEITDIYYTGLMSVFGVGHKSDSPANNVNVDLKLTGDHQYQGDMRLVDGFATFKPIVINLKIQTNADADDGSILDIRVSPQDDSHAIWSDLQAAIGHIHGEQPITPLAPLAHLPRGEWRTTPANGYQQRDIWTWGPSKQALSSITTNSEATNESVFGSFRVIYHHPGRDEIAVLALSAPELIQTGTLTLLEDLDLRFDMTLFYDQEELPWAPEPTRTISSVWTFDTPTSYANHWIEDQGRSVDPSMTGWRYTWHDDITPLPANATAPPEHVRRLNAFLPLLESEWETDATRTAFTWIPYNEAIHMRTTDTRSDESIVEMIIYPHPHTKAIHTLTIHGSGTIDEGIATVEAGVILIRAERADGESAIRIEQRIERRDADAIRIQTWSVNGAERTRLDDTTHKAAADPDQR